MKKGKKVKKRKRTCLWVVAVSVWTFFLAITFTWLTRSLLHNIQSAVVSFGLLLLIILVGIVFDIVGTAVTAAEEKPFHAKASKKIYGAKRAIYLLRYAEQVANFCNDVIGDISGIVSGVIGAVIIINLAARVPELGEIFLSILVAGFVSAITVGGKALGKTLAIKNPTQIVLIVARFLTAFERFFIWKKHRRR